MNGSLAKTRNRSRYYGDGRDWETPPEVFGPLNEEFKFTLDPCARPETAKVARFYTERDNGLGQSWENEIVFMNPPYASEIRLWVYKACHAAEYENATVVGLLPASTGRDWFHDYILDPGAEIRYIRGRIRFLHGGERWSSPFIDSMIVIWRPHG